MDVQVFLARDHEKRQGCWPGKGEEAKSETLDRCKDGEYPKKNLA
jgi:hypothetical protein